MTLFAAAVAWVFLYALGAPAWGRFGIAFIVGLVVYGLAQEAVRHE